MKTKKTGTEVRGSFTLYLDQNGKTEANQFQFVIDNKELAKSKDPKVFYEKLYKEIRSQVEKIILFREL